MIDLRSPRVALAALALVVGALAGSGTQDSDPLSASADVGRILDREGTAARRAVQADRWGPAEAGAPLEVGDWLEVGSRGANALSVRLAGGAELTLGPGALVELAAPDRVALLRGELEVDALESAPVEVTGPGRTTIAVDERAVLRAADRKLTPLERDPGWLAGYESNASTEALGSLLANVDGRNVPLTIGYHKVTVDVRDQIARTVIEESFVNHTSSVLEGVFYFPLPADSSISGFGMWIGNELVQGEIVEKQRAREIYETILRERRDPGLLEWTGGNLFKARVYPIGSEKRIRIAYTQVLPKEGDGYVYRYGLESELLRRNPLGRLEISVTLSSAEPLASVECPSHPCRIRAGEHSASVEFAAEEFAPEGDFELRVETASSGGPSGEGLTVVPHRRGDDGYFMLLVDAPEAPPAENQRGRTEPLELLVLTDTSGSMWGAPRERQVAFVEALVAALGERDTFNLATCDVETRWAFERATRRTAQTRELALTFLERRDPLGWSDLQAAFASALARAGANTHVVYVGDGVPTAGAADPVALAHELVREYPGRGTFHAVVPGSGSEMVVLRALAGLGGGSVRTMGGGTDPAQAAFGLLEEMTSPAVVDLALAFEGLPVAAVYPERLPNLSAGGQQIVVGRFDPRAEGGGDLSGKVVLTGTLDGREVRIESDVTLAADDEGNSFIPRLWARHHLDHLLDQGSSPEIRERIVTMSEDFQIATPYSSFLVLESDEDRARFGVEKRFRMRDGEEFFTAGRDSATHELTRQQMLAAQGWRARLRERVLEELEGMGRDLTELLRGQALPMDQVAALGFMVSDGPMGAGGEKGAFRGQTESRSLEGYEDELGQDRDELAGWEDAGEADTQLSAAPMVEEEMVMRERVAAKSAAPSSRRISAGGLVRQGRLLTDSDEFFLGGRANMRADWNGYHYNDPFGGVFPQVAAPRGPDPEWSWPEGVVRLLDGLDRRAAIAAGDGAWSFRVASTYADPRGREQTARGLHLIGADRWVVVDAHVRGSIYGVRWVEPERRGVLLEGWRLGGSRLPREGDLGSWSAPFQWHFGDYLRRFAAYEATETERADGYRQVDLSLPNDPDSLWSLVIDPERGLLLEEFHSSKGEVTGGVRFSEHREVGGLWWPGAIESWNANGLGSTTTAVDVEALAADELAQRVSNELARLDDAIVMDQSEVDLAAAKQTARDGEAGLKERWMLLRHYARTQRWDAARVHLEAIAELTASPTGDRPGLAQIRAVFLRQSRRLEELRLLLHETGSALAAGPRDADHGMALQLLQYGSSLNRGNEVLALLEDLHPVFVRQEELLDVELEWDRQMLGALGNMNRPESLFEAYRTAAARWPFALGIQTGFATSLAQRGEVDDALAVLRTVEDERGPWRDYELTQLRNATLQILWNSYRLEQLVRFFEEWERARPELVDQYVCDQYLSALIFLDREEQAFGHIVDWLAAAAKEERTQPEKVRMQAALQHALGQGHRLYHQRLDDQRTELLRRVGRELALGSEDYLASSVVQHWTFRRSDPGRALLAELYALLEAEVESLPARKVQSLVNWLRGASYRSDEPEAWDPILERAYARWLASEDEAERPFLFQVVAGHGSSELRLRAYRRVLSEATDPGPRVAAAQQLFTALLAEPWSEGVQAELAGLLPTLALELADDAGTEESHRAARGANLDQRVIALHDLSTWAQRARAEAVVAALPELELMSRRTLASERGQALREARAAAADLLQGLEPTLTPAELKGWAAIERTWLQVSDRSELAAAWDRALELLAAEVASFGAAEDAEQLPLRDRLLAQRALMTCSWLLASSGDEVRDGRLAPFRALLERLIELELDFPDGRAAVRDLLIALDRGDELEAALGAWYGEGGDLARIRWGRERARVLAERGRLEEAAAVLEEIDRIDELSPEDLEFLSGWYTALDRPEAAREARIRGYEVLGENALANQLAQEQGAYQRYGDAIPPELDPQIPLRFVALLRKARDPQHRLYLLRGYYEATKDYRLLECLPEAVLGQSAQKIYEVLKQAGSLAQVIDEEATVDRLQAHLAELHDAAATDVDRRALRLLQFQVVLRAARQAHGTERHAERSLRALGETFRTGWEEGEVGLMAEFLAMQGRLEPGALAQEQLRQLQELNGLARDPDERLQVALHLARTLWTYDGRDAAVRTLAGALAERRAEAGRLPQAADDAMRELSRWHVELRNLRSAERLWLAELEAGHPQQRELWLKEQLYLVWKDAVLLRADVSLGSDEALYSAVVRTLLADLAQRTNEGHAGQVVNILRDLWYRVHREQHLAAAGRDATDFAFARLPAVLDLYQYRGGQQWVGQTADLLRQVRDDVTALEFLVVRAENEPRWLRLQSQAFWQQHAWRFGDILSDVGMPPDAGPGALEQRALAIVLAELREDLVTRQSSNRTVYDHRYNHFWSAQRAAFLETALDVLVERQDSPYSVDWIAEYLFRGLGAQDEAIAALGAVWRRGELHFEGRDHLATFLQEALRWGESIPVVVELIEDRPEVARYRVMLMKAYHHEGDRGSLARALQEAEVWLRAEGWWQEAAIAELAHGCVDTRLFADGARLYDEAIALHVRTAPGRGVGDGILSSYYRSQALAYSGLGRTGDAVDASAGAIVSWGRRIDQRRQELARLVEVLAEARDLAAYVETLDVEARETGLENPIVRQALGRVHLDRGEHEAAAGQLRRALLARPDDEETHRLLLAALEGMNRPDLAADALLDWARTAERELQLWSDLGQRLGATEGPDRAERAFTNLVELSPHESEGHEALAGVRERQERWDEAAESWRHVTRIRTAEPRAYLGLARALIRAGRTAEAREVLERVRTGSWPPRFGNVQHEAESLLQGIRG